MRKISVNFDEFDVYSCTLYIAQINLDGRRAPAHAIEHRRHLMAHAIICTSWPPRTRGYATYM